MHSSSSSSVWLTHMTNSSSQKFCHDHPVFVISKHGIKQIGCHSLLSTGMNRTPQGDRCARFWLCCFKFGPNWMHLWHFYTNQNIYRTCTHDSARRFHCTCQNGERRTRTVSLVCICILSWLRQCSRRWLWVCFSAWVTSQVPIKE